MNIITKIKFFFPILLFGTAVFLGGCQPQVVEVEVAREVAVAPAVEPGEKMRLDEYTAVNFREGSVEGTAQQAQPAVDRLIIRSANLDVVVDQTEPALQTFAQTAEEVGGWVVSSNIRSFGESNRGEITMRIPADQFDAVLDGIKADVIEVRSETISGQDVTEEFVDLTARLDNLEATAARVRTFLDETKNVEEALAVNVELSRLEEQIELIKGRMQYLSESVAFSTIYIAVQPDELSRPIEVAGWRPQGIARDAVEALIETLQTIGSFFIWVGIYVLPLGFLVLSPLYLIGRWGIRRVRGSRLTRNETTPVESQES